MKPFFVYILKCSDESYYIGHTDDIETRIAQHNEGEINCYTKTRLPVEVVFTECCASRAEAIEAERKLKGWSRKKKEALISGGWEAVKGIWRK